MFFTLNALSSAFTLPSFYDDPAATKGPQQRTLSTAPAADGATLVTWTEFEPSVGTHVMMQFIRANGTPLTTAKTLGDGTDPRVVQLADGGHMVTYMSGTEVIGLRFDATGAQIDPPVFQESFELNTWTYDYWTSDLVVGYQFQVDARVYDYDVAALPDGGFVYALERSGMEGESYNIAAQRFDSSLDIQPHVDMIESQVRTSDRDGWERQPAVTAVGDNQYAMVWLEDANVTGGEAIRGRIFTADGTGTEDYTLFPLNTPDTVFDSGGSLFDVTDPALDNDHGNLQAISLSDGGFVVGWDSYNVSATDYGDVNVRIYNADGTARTVEFRPSAITFGSQGYLDLAAVPGGGFVAVWSTYDVNYDEWQIRGRIFDADGHGLDAKFDGGEFRITTPYSTSHIDPDVSVHEDGTITVAWTDSTRNVLFDSSTNNYGNIQTFQPILNGTEEADELGIDGAAYILALGGDDKLTGDAYDDYFDGGNGADTLIGGAGHDTLMGGGDETDLRDVIYGGDGDDSIDGGYGNDELRGDAGADTITGGYGSDTVIGGDGDDVLTGQTWGDILFGGAGNDFVNGGFGHDRVNGGDGADQFYHIGNAGHGSDWIQDFNHAEGDSLIWGAGAATADDFLVQRAHTQNAGAANVDEVFITHKASGLLAWALVDGDAQTSLMVTAGGATFDLLA